MSNGTAPSAAPKARPVKLQVNNSGAWKDVVRFDAGDDPLTSKAMEAASMLCDVHVAAGNTPVRFRIVTDSTYPVRLWRTSLKGWEVDSHED